MDKVFFLKKDIIFVREFELPLNISLVTFINTIENIKYTVWWYVGIC